MSQKGLWNWPTERAKKNTSKWLPKSRMADGHGETIPSQHLLTPPHTAVTKIFECILVTWNADDIKQNYELERNVPDRIMKLTNRTRQKNTSKWLPKSRMSGDTARRSHLKTLLIPQSVHKMFQCILVTCKRSFLTLMLS